MPDSETQKGAQGKTLPLASLLEGPSSSGGCARMGLLFGDMPLRGCRSRPVRHPSRRKTAARETGRLKLRAITRQVASRRRIVGAAPVLICPSAEARLRWNCRRRLFAMMAITYSMLT